MKANSCVLAAALALCTVACEPASEDPVANVVVLSVQEPCDPVVSTCVAAADGGLTLGIRMLGRVRTLTKFPIEVQVTGMQPQEVIAEFSMVDMDMGQNRYRLVRDPAGTWRAEVILPLCTSGRRDWVAAISAHATDRTATARFPFRAVR